MVACCLCSRHPEVVGRLADGVCAHCWRARHSLPADAVALRAMADELPATSNKSKRRKRNARWLRNLADIIDPPKAPEPLRLAALPQGSEEWCVEVLRIAERVEVLAKFARAGLLERALAGQRIEGWKLVQPHGQRRWINEKQTVAALLALGLPRDAIMREQRVREPAALERLVPKEIIQDLWHQPVQGPLRLVQR